tara:strand:+ start:1279 stop:2706 length:1428 start_codon:yes stop_codon:yes gene_type:complete
MSTNDRIVIHIFTRDFRLQDNPSLFHAASCGRVWPVFIDDHDYDPYPAGGASRWWLYQSLKDLQQRLSGGLSIFKGELVQVISELVERFPVQGVFWNRYFDQYHRGQEDQLLKILQKRGIAGRNFNAALLWNPWLITKDDGTFYKVFTPFYRRGCLSGPYKPRPVLQTPSHLEMANVVELDPGLALDSSGILPSHAWHKKLESYWKVSEDAAHQCLQQFIENGIGDYKKGRDFPGKKHVSRLSPYLRHGQISPSQIWDAVDDLPPDDNVAHFKSELGWREFSYYLLFHYPHLPEQNLQPKFDRFQWEQSAEMLDAWQRGLTGIPIVDAGMRELYETGYMHNRLRMIVGSFLVKNMGHHWVEGERWFRNCLVDFDLASNSASWQWVAGCGTDAAPYFRIFNPVTQGQRFDPEGIYTKRFVPELARLPQACLFAPWEAPGLVLQEADVVLGDNYPRPIVDLKSSREVALEKFRKLSS